MRCRQMCWPRTCGGTERGGPMQLHLEIRDVVEILRTVAGLEKPGAASWDLLCAMQTSGDAVEAPDSAREPTRDLPDDGRRGTR